MSWDSLLDGGPLFASIVAPANSAMDLVPMMSVALKIIVEASRSLRTHLATPSAHLMLTLQQQLHNPPLGLLI